MIGLQQHESSTLAQDLSPDLTPMLDILFILLVFFMLTAGAILQSLDLTLPSSVTEELDLVNEPMHIMLEIRRDSYAIDGNEYNSFEAMDKDLDATIKSRPAHELIIAGDKDIPLDRLLKVLTHLQAKGISAANILMQQEDMQ